MYPDLSYFLHELFGTPVDNWSSVIQSFGLFLTLAVVTSGLVLYLEFKRYEKEGIFSGTIENETIGAGPKLTHILSNALVGFLLGFKLVYIIMNFAEFKGDAAGVVLSSKGTYLLEF